MKRIVLCLLVAGAVPWVAAQTPVPASAQGKSLSTTAWPKPISTANEAQAMRLDILNDEREQISKKLSDAMAALPKSTDQQASLKDLSRLQADLMAIDREIANAEGRDRKGAAPTQARKPVAQAAGDVTTAQGPLVEAADAKTEYEAWDVFKNFGKKGN